jgi:hypothetical protein
LRRLLTGEGDGSRCLAFGFKPRAGDFVLRPGRACRGLVAGSVQRHGRRRYSRGPIFFFETSRRSQPGLTLKSPMVRLDPVVRVLLRVAKRPGNDLVDHRGVDGGLVGGHLDGTYRTDQGTCEEPWAARTSRLTDSITSTTWPNYSTAGTSIPKHRQLSHASHQRTIEALLRWATRAADSPDKTSKKAF